jgi:type VII secretion-associated serine protease mycosin
MPGRGTLTRTSALAVAATVGTAAGLAVPGPPAGYSAPNTAAYSAAVAAPPCGEIAAGTSLSDVPWAQQRLAPERLAPLADGSGITVAVIDSGVDRRHPQLRGRVGDGADFLDAGPDGTLDCVGHGTAVASLIAAGPPPARVPFRGLAPGVEIVPVRVSEQHTIDGETQGRTAGAGQFAAAIRWAVDSGKADVLNLSVVLLRDEPAVRAAIAHALARNVVVVAAAGNAHGQGNPTPYPAAYDGVLGVGAINADGVREDYSQVGDYVDVVAPGGGVAVAWPDGRYSVQSGTSYATPFVAATAALVRQYRPDLSAREVARRIMATADPAPGGGDRSGAYGSGVVNPYRAVTEEVAAGAPERATPLATLAADPAALAAQKRRAENRRDALLLAFGGGAAAVLVLILALVVPRGARRRWRPAEPA